MITKKDLSRIGIGTWGYGGFATRDYSKDDQKQIAAISFLLENGINFIEANIWSAEGHSVYLVSQALKKSRIPRDKSLLIKPSTPTQLKI